MIQVLSAAVIWALVLCLLNGIKHRKDHSILVAAVTIAAALTLNIDGIYLAGDRLLGSRNVLDLCSSTLMVVGIYYLSRAIIRAADLNDTDGHHQSGGLWALGLVVVALTVSFSFIESPQTSTAFMVDYGDQWAAAAYSSIQFLYIGVVVSVTGFTCFKFRSEMAKRYFRVAFTFIGIGCSLALVLVVDVLTMDILHLGGQIKAMKQLSLVFDVAQVGAMVFLCLGLALPPVARRLERSTDSRTTAYFVDRLTEPWSRLTATRSQGRLTVSESVFDSQEALKYRLHRMLVEIQDALFLDPDLAELLDARDIQVLGKAEEHLQARLAARDHRRSTPLRRDPHL
ncbi:hypothetical protein [Arthrobacter sp. Soil762]|uniref:hypothetical protein n=1 Tax=Arthrobacter sp. Soil762 TaxID=1736401 RepID=UPI0006F57C23|nr:hypothetical protein [Arthrobacter sp. Soil762]KRE72741.1 hypothetical protein ASG77_08745 [Arthrobacter sp. Soil762]